MNRPYVPVRAFSELGQAGEDPRSQPQPHPFLVAPGGPLPGKTFFFGGAPRVAVFRSSMPPLTWNRFDVVDAACRVCSSRAYDAPGEAAPSTGHTTVLSLAVVNLIQTPLTNGDIILRPSRCRQGDRSHPPTCQIGPIPGLRTICPGAGRRRGVPCTHHYTIDDFRP